VSGRGDRLRAALVADVAAAVPPAGLAVVALSGGVDSCAALFACLAAGRRTRAVTFTLADRTSSDMVAAGAVATAFDVPCAVVFLPTDETVLARDLRDLVRLGLGHYKTDVECTWPFLYVLPTLPRGATLVLGHGADDHFGLDKRCALHYRKGGAVTMDLYRDEQWDDPDPGQTVTLARYGAAHGVGVCAPFFSAGAKAALRGTSWDEVNRPHEKQPVLDAFAAEFARVKVRRHQNFQLGDSGIAAGWLRLLADPLRNPYGWKNPVALYRRIERAETGRRTYQGVPAPDDPCWEEVADDRRTREQLARPRAE
jgi:asparagine synthase